MHEKQTPLADLLERVPKRARVVEREQFSTIYHPVGKFCHDAAAELRRLHGLIDECAIYLKEGETPAQRIARDHGDSIALMTLLAREKRKSETLLEALKRVKETKVFLGAVAQGMMDAAITKAEE